MGPEKRTGKAILKPKAGHHLATLTVTGVIYFAGNHTSYLPLYRKRVTVSEEEPPSKTKNGTVSGDGHTTPGSHLPARSRSPGARGTHGVAAVLIDDDPVRERFVVGLDVQSTLPRIQGVFLDKINVIDSCNL